MKNKKIIHIVSILCFCICSAATASAQINKTAETSVLNGIAEFSGQTDASEGKITYLVKPQGAADEDFLAIGETNTAKDGSFAIEFGLTQSGTYVLDMRDFAGDTYSETIEYTTAEDRQKQLLESINTGTESDIKKALSELDYSYGGVSFNALESDAQNQIAKYLKICGTYESMAEAEEEYKKQNAFYMINTAKVAGIKAEVKKHRDFLGLAENNAVNKFITLSGTVQQAALVNSLSASPAYTTELLVSAITAANSAQSSSKPSSGGGGGGGGSNTSNANRFPVTAIKPAEEEKAEETKGFADMDASHWASAAVNTLAEKGVVSGDENGNFRPNSTITREEFVKMVVVAFGVKNAENNFVFLDVFDSDWYFECVGAAYEAGIVNGISDGFFGINKPITRQDAAVILKRAADYAGIALNEKRAYSGFNDENKISDYAAEAVNTLYRSGVIDGMDDGEFKPADFCTRAETAKMICEII